MKKIYLLAHILLILDLSTFLLTVVASVEIYIKYNKNEGRRTFRAHVEMWEARIRELLSDTNLTQKVTFEGLGVRVHLKPLKSN